MPRGPSMQTNPVRVTLRQVAEAVGCSTMAVSQALSGAGRLAPATRKRIKAVAARMGYRSNRLIRAVQSGRSHTVGVIMNPARYYTGQVFQGIHDELGRYGWLPIVHFSSHVPGTDCDSNELANIHRLLEHRVDGLIFWPTDDTAPDIYFKEVWRRGVPLVAVDRQLLETRADFSGTDDVAGGRLVMEHLLDLGHRHILHVCGDQKVATFVDRLQGCRLAARGRGVRMKTLECSVAECRDLVADVLRQGPRPTVISAASDLLAKEVYDSLDDLGLRPGRDISVVGYADLPEARWLRPGLTTVRQDFDAIGRNAARLLLDRIERKITATSPRSIRLVPELVVRQSTSHCPTPDRLRSVDAQPH
jgi:LacI family transcriptional regulator